VAVNLAIGADELRARAEDLPAAVFKAVQNRPPLRQPWSYCWRFHRASFGPCWSGCACVLVTGVLRPFVAMGRESEAATS
jgi:hypothetical protein